MVLAVRATRTQMPVHTVNPRNKMCDSKRFENKHKLLCNNANVTTTAVQWRKMAAPRQSDRAKRFAAAATKSHHLCVEYAEHYALKAGKICCTD